MPFGERGTRLDECVAAMRRLWSDAPATFRGRHYAFEDIHCSPRPTSGRVPIVFGGHSRAAVERAGRSGDGWFPFAVGADVFRRGVARIRELAVDRPVEFAAWPGGRPFDAVEARAFVAAGADRLVFRPQWGGGDPVARAAAQVGETVAWARQLAGSHR